MSDQHVDAARHAPDETTPILSTLDRGRRMTQLLPGRPVGRFTAGMGAQTLLCTVGWALASSPPCAAYLAVAPSSVGSPWGMGAAIVVAYVAVSLTIGLAGWARETFGQARVAGLLISVVMCTGLAVSAALWSVVSYADRPRPVFDLDNIATSPTLPRELVAVIGGAIAVWGLGALVRLGAAIDHARTRQATIDGLRRAGSRHIGTLTSVDFEHAWIHADPLFRFEVTYAEQGEEQVVHGRMRTSQSRVPVAGTRVIVLTDSTGAAHVELDASSGIEFEPDHGRYAPSEG